MAKVLIKIEGSTEGCINDLAQTMLQHDGIREVVLGAAARINNIEELKAQMLVEDLKEMINHKESPHDTDKPR